MLISQILDDAGKRAVVVRNGSEASVLKGVASTYELVQEAIAKGQSLTECIRGHELGAAVDLEQAGLGRPVAAADRPPGRSPYASYRHGADAPGVRGNS